MIGFAAGGLGMVTGVPQARRVKMLGHGEGVSLASWMVIASANSAWFGYGLRIDAPAVSVSNVLTLIVTLSVVVSLSGFNRRTITVSGSVVLLSVSSALLLPAGIVSAAMVGFTLSRLPQVVASRRSKRNGVEGTAVSLSSMSVSMASLVLWGVYSIVTDQPFLVLTTSVAFVLAVLISWYELTNKSSVVRVRSVTI